MRLWLVTSVVWFLVVGLVIFGRAPLEGKLLFGIGPPVLVLMLMAALGWATQPYRRR